MSPITRRGPRTRPHRRPGRGRAAVAALALLAAAAAADDAATDGPGAAPDEAVAAAWEAVARGDAVALMRHALAPGTGDPAGFDVGDCATQRNLSAAGRAQAERIGAHVARALGGASADVLSSAWCRCLDTARLLGLGDVTVLPALNSFFGARADAAASTRALRGWIDARLGRGAPPAVLVTHQVNISALSGGFAASGEILLVDADDGVLARVAIDPD